MLDCNARLYRAKECESMNITLSPQLEELVKRMVESGQYSSSDDVIREALELLDERNKKLEALRRDIQDGLNSPSKPFDEAAVESIKARGRERLARERERRQAL
jgi:antitoxin ParD1/3/4